MLKIKLLVAIFLFVGVVSFSILTYQKQIPQTYCSQKSDCVPADCCHPNACVNIKFKPDCKGIACTLECKLGTMDCDQGYCDCVDNECRAVIK